MLFHTVHLQPFEADADRGTLCTTLPRLLSLPTLLFFYYLEATNDIPALCCRSDGYHMHSKSLCLRYTICIVVSLRLAGSSTPFCCSESAGAAAPNTSNCVPPSTHQRGRHGRHDDRKEIIRMRNERRRKRTPAFGGSCPALAAARLPSLWGKGGEYTHADKAAKRKVVKFRVGLFAL